MRPYDAITVLVERTRALSDGSNPESVRHAFERVLAELRVEPGELWAWRDGADVIGSAFEQLLPGEYRRPAGQFFTPVWAGETMARWLLAEPTRLLLDPGCGSGALLIAAARHRRNARTRLLGIDRDPLAVRMADVNRSLRRISACELRIGDFLLDSLDDRPDAIACNPPYSRHHDIPPAEKARIHEGFERRLGSRLSRLASLHVLFLVRALEVCADGGRIAFITPSDWLDVGYGKAVKQLLLEQAHVEAVLTFPTKELFFDEVLTTAAITLIRKDPAAIAPTKVIKLGGRLPSPGAVVSAVRGAGGMQVHEVALDGWSKWSRLPGRHVVMGLRLADIARVRRGIATGCNRFFVMSEARRRELGISLRDLRPCITSPRVFSGSELWTKDLDSLPDDVPRWVLDCRDPSAEHMNDALGRYLRWGRRSLEANSGYLASRRHPWFSLERRGDCPILFTYFNRSRPRFVRNYARAVPLNTWLIVEPKVGVDPDGLFRALTSRFVIAQLEAAGRRYGGGLWKLEPAELSEVRLPRTFRTLI